jgi:hypothetical protein
MKAMKEYPEREHNESIDSLTEQGVKNEDA